ncbi:MAG: V-type ATPase 116kDa subunit family protein [Bacteroidales bacterium]|nr:V-type ATPase 116kDa subunit family protein [Bacteroidales bacterium]
MKKVSFLIHHKDYHQFLVDLQQIGIVDVVDRGVEPDAKTAEEIALLQQIIKVSKFLDSKTEGKEMKPSALGYKEILDTIQQMQSESESLKHKINALDKAYKSLLPWGDFSKETIEKLEKHGYQIRFFEVAERKFLESWSQEYNLEIIHRSEGQYYFVIVQLPGEKIEIDAEEVRAPERPASEVLKEKEELTLRAEEINRYYKDNAAALIPVLEKARNEKENAISFDRVIDNTNKEAADRLMIIEGWIPKPKIKEMETFLNDKQVFHIMDEPLKTEKVPIMLHNNNFSRLFEPIGKLYSLPKYSELDLTPFFAPFFMMFFGFCLGDAGYGLLFLIGATLFKKKIKAQFRPVLTLLQWLGSATILFGIVSGTFFGINLIELIDKGQLTFMSEMRAYMLDSEKMFYFALVLGGIQIVYGMVIKALNLYKQFGLHHAMTTIGWILLILGNLVLYFVKNDNNQGIVNIFYYVIFGISGVFILFMNNPGKNIFINFGGGLWEVYSIVTGVLGDLLSYIRLFALGVSSAILGYVFNDLALQMSGSTPVVSQLIFLIIIIIGHGLNIFMATLGAFVHPMRLTFVEFYKNAGFNGGGKAYNPFAKKTQEL